MKHHLFILIAGCLLFCASCGEHKPQPSRAALDSVLQKQVVLTNHAAFTESRAFTGGSAFLMRYENQLWAVTPRHMIHDYDSMQPGLNPNDLPAALINWQMYPRNTQAKGEVRVHPSDSPYPDYAEDILLLKPDANGAGFAELVPEMELPAVDDTLYIVGCLKSDPSGRQQTFPVVFQKYKSKKAEMTFLMDQNLKMDGFGGAPILNRQGKVVALLVREGQFLNLRVVIATHIGAIKQALPGGA